MTLKEFVKKYIIYNKEGVPSVNKELNDTLESLIKNNERVKHSLSVGSLSFEIAKSNHLYNPIRFYVAGVLHDIAKGLSKEDEAILMNKYYPRYKNMPRYCFHQFLAEYVIKEELKFSNIPILNAIKCHCTGKKNMSTIDKILYASDKIDPLRGYDSSYMIEAMKKNYLDGFLFVLNENYKFIETKNSGKPSSRNRLSDECFNFYLNIC
ncbi:MAG: bis(5'-nucleosyl)-tetraphosphatase (symmetrical) YqeK [Bacilli bacterium]|nr:bis(5'-nucleosyl)-tetraphosphatase (symmetrical) YqeK [Bacilli bacterium]